MYIVIQRSNTITVTDLCCYIFTGSTIVDDIITVLLSTSMFIGGAVAFFLDNTMPGMIDDVKCLKNLSVLNYSIIWWWNFFLDNIVPGMMIKII